MISLASFNVNSVRSRIELLNAWFEHRGDYPDILCMQEIKAEENQYPFEFFKDFNYECFLNVQKRYNGVATCTRLKPVKVITDFGNEILNEQKRLIYTEFKSFGLLNLYAPHGGMRGTDKFEYKLKWYDALMEWIRGQFPMLENTKLILTGDFNVTMDDRDVYDPELLKDSIGTMPEERDKLHALIQMGFIDAFRLLHPDSIQYTWWDYQGARIWKNQGMRIDYIFITPALKNYLKKVEVDMWARRKNKIKPSDHAPVIAVFEGLD